MPRITDSRRPGLLALTALLIGAPAAAQEVAWSPVPDGMPRTAAETNDFSRHTHHAEMMDYLEALRGTTTDMRLGSYGETREGRDLPYAVFTGPLISEPWEAWALGRPIVVLAANVHGGERTFREGLLVLMRDFATPGTEAWDLLDDVTVVVVPQINPDGFEARDGGGWRGNSWGIDLNRDYVKLEQPSIVQYVGLLGDWRPHVYVDGHNGGSRPYNLNYQCPSHADPAQELTLICDQRIFPAIDAKLEAEGYKSWYYTGGNEEEWRGGGYEARIGRNYGGFVNSVAILFEAPGQSLEVGARAGYLGYLAVTQWAAENPDELIGTVQAARMETIALGAEPRGEIAVEMEYEAEDYLVDYEIMRGGGQNSDEPPEIVQVTGARLIKKPVPTRTRARPWAYLLPRDAVDAVAMLRRHGILVEQLIDSTTLTVDAYTVAGVTHERAYNHAAATKVEVGEVTSVEEEFPRGTYVVPTAQFLGRLVAHMLEPETTDNVIYWNTMDAWIPRPGTDVMSFSGPGGAGTGQGRETPLVPIFKLMAPTPLPTRMVEGSH